MTRLQRAIALARADRIGYLLGRRCARLTDPERIYHDIARAAAAAVKADLAALAVFVPEEGTLRIVSTYGYPQ